MKTECLVIGGGLAGAAAAIRLARHGKHVTLLERERTAQHKVCGEFLSAEALLYLNLLGVDPSELGALPIDTVRLAGRGAAMQASLPFQAVSLTRRCLDEALLQQAERCGANVQRGCTVERLLHSNDEWQATLANGEHITANSVFLATGKHDLRGHPRPPGKQRNLIAFKMYFRLAEEQARQLAGTVELITYTGGYAGLQPVEDGAANLCCLVQAETLRTFGDKWSGLLHHMCAQSPHLRSRLEGAEPLLAKPLTIASIPYGFVRESSDGIWHVGDQAVVIPSFTGDGMSIALHTGLLAAQMHIGGCTANEYQQKVSTHVRSQVRLATVASQALVNAPRASLWLPKLWPSAIGFIAQRTRIAAEHIVN